MEPQARPRRSLLNIRLLRGTQLRMVFLGLTAGILVSCWSLYHVLQVANLALHNAAAADPALVSVLDGIKGTITGACAVGLIFNFASAMIALIFGLMVSHRFYGPIVPLRRHLLELESGRFAARVRLRPGDELTELMDAQNTLAQGLEKRFGPNP